jgi:hypothetical protein
VAVHFITVTERFAPHDFVLNITSPEELSDAALTAACTLHTAAPSSSSSSGSSRQQKLSWIQEAADEGSQLGGDDHASARPLTARSIIPTIMEPVTPIDEMPERNLSMISDGAESVPLILDILEEKAPEPKPAPEISHVTIETVTEAPKTPDSDLTELQATMKGYDKLFEDGPEPRSSTQTARPNYDDLYEHYLAQYTKPKVKLGPRPRPSLDGQRPSTSGLHHDPNHHYRLASALRREKLQTSVHRNPETPASYPASLSPHHHRSQQHLTYRARPCRWPLQAEAQLACDRCPYRHTANLGPWAGHKRRRD